jgi:hypothetical protein
MEVIGIGDLERGPESALKDGAIVLLADEKPLALVIGLREGEDPQELERLVRQARAQAAVSRIRERAMSGEGGPLTSDDIDAEIRAVREMRARHADRP